MVTHVFNECGAYTSGYIEKLVPPKHWYPLTKPQVATIHKIHKAKI
jgi:hypothetical protein